jgi:hypothetical protein
MRAAARRVSSTPKVLYSLNSKASAFGQSVRLPFNYHKQLAPIGLGFCGLSIENRETHVHDADDDDSALFLAPSHKARTD